MEKIIFLDLDGVLIRFTQKRFGYNLENTKNECINKYGDALLNVDPYDLGAMYYDFNAESIELLKTLINETGAKIVVSSDWRIARDFETQLRPLFCIHGLSDFVIGATIDFYKNKEKMDFWKGLNPYAWMRAGEVAYYLKENIDRISNFVILDDVGFDLDTIKFMKDRFVKCEHYFDTDAYQKAIKILQASDGNLERQIDILFGDMIK